MAIARARKEEWVASFRQDLAEAPFVLVAAPKGLNAGEVSGLRRTLRQGGGGYRVVRNRLAALALKDTANEPLIELLDAGERAVAYAGEGAALSKACAQYAKEWEERFVIVGGMMDGSRISAGEVKALAELPPLDSLRAKLIGLLEAPASKLARTLNEPAASLARLASAKGAAE